MDQLPRLGKRELICLLLFTCNYVVFVWRGFLFLWVLGMGCVILLWHSLSLPYNYFGLVKRCVTPYRIYLIISIGFGTKLDRQIVSIPKGTNCAQLVAYLFISYSTQPQDYELKNIDYPYFEVIVNQIYLPHL